MLVLFLFGKCSARDISCKCCFCLVSVLLGIYRVSALFVW